jgi:hypothetical protein
MRRYLPVVVVGLLAAVASAGLFAATTNDLGPLVPLEIPASWQLPLLTLIGALMSLALRDFKRSVVALGIATLGGALLYAAALASPGYIIDPVAVMLSNRALVQGTVALMITATFLTVGAALALGFNVFVRKLDA